MFDAEKTKASLVDAAEYFLRIDPVLAEKMASALTALKDATCPQDFVWTETYTPEKEYFHLTLWRGKTPIDVATLTSSDYYWVQYCGRGWNLTMTNPFRHRVSLGQMSGFAAACEFLRARAKKEWGCPMTEEEAKLADYAPHKPWA